MAANGFRLAPQRPIPAQIRSVARFELESAAKRLEAAGAGRPGVAIHDARKSIKKVRAVLRLMRPELERTYRLENRRLRDIARKLAEFRDAGAVIGTLDRIAKRYSTEGPLPALAIARRTLAKKKRETMDENKVRSVLKAMAAELRSIAARAGKWPLRTRGFEAVEPGLEMTLRRGRKAFARARKHPAAGNFHEWRKRAKDHWYHIRLLADIWTKDLKAYEKHLDDLQECLGEHHNLVILREALKPLPPEVEAVVDRYEKELRAEAESLAAAIYERKPRRLVKEIRSAASGGGR